MDQSLKKKSIKGLFWSGWEKMFNTSIQLLIGIILARLLMPSDYGAIGVLMVFISFSQVFIDGGFTSALIQKKEKTEIDYHTAFIYNMIISACLYLILFIFAPYIAIFYDNSLLCPLLRVLGINLLISCFTSIQITRLTVLVDFKTISYSTISSSIVSGACGIIFAYCGLGVWALVAQQVTGAFLRAIILMAVTKWYPKFIFSKESFHSLFSFGSKMLLTNIVSKVYDNLYPLIIGKKFPPQILGYYTKASEYTVLVTGIPQDMFMRVSFPIMSSIQDDDVQLKNIFRKYIILSSFVIFPIMFLLMVISRPLIVALLTEKWLLSVPFMRILAIGFMFSHICSINLNLILVKGRSDLALKLEIIKKTIAVTILIISLYWGIWGICIGQSIYCIVAVFLNAIYTKKLINLAFFDQLKDYGKIWFMGAFAASISYALIQLVSNIYIQITVGVFSFLSLYLLIHYIFKSKSLLYMVEFMKEKIFFKK